MKTIATILFAGMQVVGGTADDGAITSGGAQPQAASVVSTAPITLPALTPVRIEVLKDVGSAISQSLDTFPIRLAESIIVDGREVISAGATGQGEVVHAKKAGGSGAAGELVLAARWLDVGGRRLRLRSMHVGLAGKDAIGSVTALNTASAVALPGASLIGFAIKGRNVIYPSGTIAQAKTAEIFTTVLADPAGTERVDEIEFSSKGG